VACNVSQERSFFNNKVMSCYRYCYNVSYSLDEFSEQAERTLVAQYELSLNALNSAAKDNYSNYTSKKIDIRQYMETADYLEEKTVQVIAKIKALKNKDGTLAGIKSIYKDQIAFLTSCKIEYGFDPEVSSHIQAQIKKFSGDSKEALAKV
jgi:hypothetical protein